MTTDPMLAYRISALETLFRQIADTRMAGLPVINRALRVEAVGFEPCASFSRVVGFGQISGAYADGHGPLPIGQKISDMP